MEYHFKVYKEGKGYWAKCLELEGCVTQADTKKELELNMQEALNLYLDEPNDSSLIFPLPRKRVQAKNTVKVPVEPRIAFASLLRRNRLEQNLTQSEVAKMLGFKNLWSYQKLERGKTANPALQTIANIKEVFPHLSLEDIFWRR